MGYSVELFLDANLYKSGIIKYVMWDWGKLPHFALFGASGSGKTYALTLLLGRIANHIEHSSIILCDYKGDDEFSFANGSANFYRYDECMDGLERAVEILRNRQQGIDKTRHFVCLVFDEWSAFLSSLDKKACEQAKNHLGYILRLGRSLNVHTINSNQTMHASDYGQFRDNFSVVCGLGSLSKEAVHMMFDSYKDVIDRNKQQGYGSIIIGNQFKEIIVPTVRNQHKLHDCIIRALNE